MRLGVLLSLQLSHMILKIHTFCAVLGCQNRQKMRRRMVEMCVTVILLITFVEIKKT